MCTAVWIAVILSPFGQFMHGILTVVIWNMFFIVFVVISSAIVAKLTGENCITYDVNDRFYMCGCQRFIEGTWASDTDRNLLFLYWVISACQCFFYCLLAHDGPARNVCVTCLFYYLFVTHPNRTERRINTCDVETQGCTIDWHQKFNSIIPHV